MTVTTGLLQVLRLTVNLAQCPTLNASCVQRTSKYVWTPMEVEGDSAPCSVGCVSQKTSGSSESVMVWACTGWLWQLDNRKDSRLPHLFPQCPDPVCESPPAQFG